MVKLITTLFREHFLPLLEQAKQKQAQEKELAAQRASNAAQKQLRKDLDKQDIRNKLSGSGGVQRAGRLFLPENRSDRTLA